MQTEQAYTHGQIEAIRTEMERRLSPPRFAHVCRVAEIAVHYAKKIGYDESRAEIAALLHDVAREFTQEQFDEAAEKYSVRLTRYNLAFTPSIHGKVGAAIAEREIGINDKEILAAIRNHVSGRPCMKTLEQIIYIADHIDGGRKFSSETSDALMDKPLDEAMYISLGQTIRYDAKNKKPVDERTLQTFDWLLEKIRNEEKSGPVELSAEKLNAMYSRMDELLDICAEHAITSFPAENLRDLGGYRAADGRVIKKHKLLRSGNPDRFAPEDFERLAAMGINYVIDLRTEAEKARKNDVGSSCIRYIDVPFDSATESAAYQKVLTEWKSECEDAEEFAWMSAKYFDSFDIDDMYLTILFDPDSQKKFRKILELLLSDDCTGVLFFCHSGKDRTGIVSAVIMNALGVGSDTVLDDYMVSQIPYYAVTVKFLNQLQKRDYNLTVQKQVIDVLSVESGRPERLNREILARFGDYKSYFDFESSFGSDAAERFRKKFLE